MQAQAPACSIDVFVPKTPRSFMVHKLPSILSGIPEGHRSYTKDVVRARSFEGPPNPNFEAYLDELQSTLSVVAPY